MKFVDRDARALKRNQAPTAPLMVANLLDADECAAIIALARSRPLLHSTMVHPVEDYRHAYSYPVDLSDDTRWVFQKLWQGFMLANAEFGFDIAGFMDSFMVTHYPRGGHVGWHTDFSDFMTSARKLTISVQLSPPEDYAGGLLEFSDQGVVPFSQTQGSAVIFPTYLSHRVTRVTRGNRWVLLSSAFGPVFR